MIFGRNFEYPTFLITYWGTEFIAETIPFQQLRDRYESYVDLCIIKKGE